MALDLLLFQFFYQIAERLSFFNFVLVSLAVYLPWLVGAFALWLLLSEKGRRARIHDALFTALVLLLSRGVIAEIVGFLIDRGRPYEVLGLKPLFTASGGSFPSGHAAMLFAVAFAMWHVRREWALWFFVAAAVVSLARVASGFHWPSVIVAGFLIALVSFLAAKWLVSRRGKAEGGRRVV